MASVLEHIEERIKSDRNWIWEWILIGLFCITVIWAVSIYLNVASWVTICSLFIVVVVISKVCCEHLTSIRRSREQLHEYSDTNEKSRKRKNLASHNYEFTNYSRSGGKRILWEETRKAFQGAGFIEFQNDPKNLLDSEMQKSLDGITSAAQDLLDFINKENQDLERVDPKLAQRKGMFRLFQIMQLENIIRYNKDRSSDSFEYWFFLRNLQYFQSFLKATQTMEKFQNEVKQKNFKDQE